MRAGARGGSASVEKRPIGGGAQPHISHQKPHIGVGRNGLSWGHAKAPCGGVPDVESPFILRAELLTLVPHSMSTIDRLEAKGQFPEPDPIGAHKPRGVVAPRGDGILAPSR